MTGTTRRFFATVSACAGALALCTITISLPLLGAAWAYGSTPILLPAGRASILKPMVGLAISLFIGAIALLTGFLAGRIWFRVLKSEGVVGPAPCDLPEWLVGSLRMLLVFWPILSALAVLAFLIPTTLWALGGFELAQRSLAQITRAYWPVVAIGAFSGATAGGYWALKIAARLLNLSNESIRELLGR